MKVPIMVAKRSETYFTPVVEDSLSEYGDDVESVIERSKSHWTQVDTSDAWADSEENLQAENGKFLQSVKEDIPSNSRDKDFFKDYGESLKVGRKMGEGGQAEIFEGTWIRNELLATQVVVKMFKHGYKLAEPRGMFHSDFASDFVCCILGATLLDGRLAFVMSRCWGRLAQSDRP